MFKIPEIQSFSEQLVQYRIYEPIAEIINDILQELDSEPFTASVATRKGLILSCSTRQLTTYAILSSIPLWQHSLNVACTIIRDTPPKGRCGVSFASEILCCLCHDIGKLLRHRRRQEYSLTSHPQIGAEVMDKLIGDRLPSMAREDIMEAVRKHHYPLSTLRRRISQLPMVVATADRQARFDEVFNARMSFSP